jgi:hypothetical protein
MNESSAISRDRPRSALRIWHLAVLVAAIAVAGAFVHNGRMVNPRLIGVAVAGFLVWCAAGVVVMVRLGRSFDRFDRIENPARRRAFKVAALVLYLLAWLTLFLAGLAIFLTFQLVFFPITL